MALKQKLRLMLVSIVPPRNDCGVRIVMHRHLVERAPFDLHVASNADFADGLLIHTKIELPFPLQKIKKSRFGPAFSKWILDFENLIWPLIGSQNLEQAVRKFQPDVILTLAETGLCHIARDVAHKYRIPLAVLFLDWYPIMAGHYGHRCTRAILSKRFRQLYKKCDLAICTSDGMQEELGAHPNSHVIYPMPGKHIVPDEIHPPKREKFRLVYVGATGPYYGPMLNRLWRELQKTSDFELIIVGPLCGWTKEDETAAIAKGEVLGFLPPQEAARAIAGADALLVVMSFEEVHRQVMKTSFTTKWLDYSAFNKPVILWGPSYCTPSKLALREDAALVVTENDPKAVLCEINKLKNSEKLKIKFSSASEALCKGLFNPDRLQNILTNTIHHLGSIAEK
jgi:hypothetical protein